MYCQEIINILEELSPTEYACSWDNVGLLVGRRDKVVNKILVVLDVTTQVLNRAINENFDMIVSHHPLIFGKIDRVNDESVLGIKLLDLIEHGICYYAMHTNFDTKGGMAKEAARLLNLTDSAVLDETMLGEGIGCIGTLPVSRTLIELADDVKRTFFISRVSCFGKLDTCISRVAICPGSGKSVIDVAIEKGAQCLITGDIGHHDGLDAKEAGLSIIDASHYGLEKIFMRYIASYLVQKGVNAEVATEENGEVFIMI